MKETPLFLKKVMDLRKLLLSIISLVSFSSFFLLSPLLQADESTEALEAFVKKVSPMELSTQYSQLRYEYSGKNIVVFSWHTPIKEFSAYFFMSDDKVVKVDNINKLKEVTAAGGRDSGVYVLKTETEVVFNMPNQQHFYLIPINQLSKITGQKFHNSSTQFEPVYISPDKESLVLRISAAASFFDKLLFINLLSGAEVSISDKSVSEILPEVVDKFTYLPEFKILSLDNANNFQLDKIRFKLFPNNHPSMVEQAALLTTQLIPNDVALKIGFLDVTALGLENSRLYGQREMDQYEPKLKPIPKVNKLPHQSVPLDAKASEAETKQWKKNNHAEIGQAQQNIGNLSVITNTPSQTTNPQLNGRTIDTGESKAPMASSVNTSSNIKSNLNKIVNKNEPVIYSPVKGELLDIEGFPVQVEAGGGNKVRAGDILRTFLTDPRADLVGREIILNNNLDSTLQKVYASLLGVDTGSAVILGESGSGKTEVMEELVRRIAVGNIPYGLRSFKIVKLDSNALGGGNNFSGSLQSKLKAIEVLAEQLNGKLIILADEIQNYRGMGRTVSDSNDVLSMLLSSMGRGKIRLLGSTSKGIWDHMASGDPMLIRRMGTVEHAPVYSEAVLLKIFKHWLVTKNIEFKFSNNILRAIIKYSDLYNPYMAQPGRAISLLNNVIGQKRAKIYNPQQIEVNMNARMSEVLDAASDLYKVKREYLIKSDFMTSMSSLREAFVELTGMESVKQALYKEAAVYLQGFEYRAGPHMRTILLGSSGSGKTSIVKALAKGLNLNIVNLKMSQYSSVPAFQGALADGLFANPTAVIFFDEIDDARPELQKSLNELLEDGEVSFVRQGTQEGQLVISKINIKNNIILAGANGSYNLEQKNSIGFNYKADNITPKDVAAEFLDPKILDRWQNFVFVPSPSREELNMAVVNGIKNYFAKLKNEKAIYIDVSENALYTWVNKMLDEGGERISYRLVSKFIHENVVISVSQYLPNFTDANATKSGKSKSNTGKSSKAQFRFELNNELEFILTPINSKNDLRCEAIL